MGTITKRKTKKGFSYRAEAYVKGDRLSKTFSQKSQAQRWILIQESTSENVVFAKSAYPLIEYLPRYFEECKIVDRHVCYYSHLKKAPLGQKAISSITEEDITEWVEWRQETPSPRLDGRPVGTSMILKELTGLSHFFKWAHKNKLIRKNPVHGRGNLRTPPARERACTDEELDLILTTAGYKEGEIPETYTQRVACAFLFSCLTGMRGGEIFKIEREWINDKTLVIPKEATKTNTTRVIALNKRAKAILDDVLKLGNYPAIWGVSSEAKRHLWSRIRKKAGLEEIRDGRGRVIKQGLNFHDGRATFCTNAAKVMDPLSLARQTGHKDLKMLMRYYRPDMSTFSEVLDKL